MGKKNKVFITAFLSTIYYSMEILNLYLLQAKENKTIPSQAREIFREDANRVLSHQASMTNLSAVWSCSITQMWFRQHWKQYRLRRSGKSFCKEAEVSGGSNCKDECWSCLMEFHRKVTSCTMTV